MVPMTSAELWTLRRASTRSSCPVLYLRGNGAIVEGGAAVGRAGVARRRPRGVAIVERFAVAVASPLSPGTAGPPGSPPHEAGRRDRCGCHPTKIDATNVRNLRPGSAPPTPPTRRTVWLNNVSSPRRTTSVAGTIRPTSATKVSSSKVTPMRSTTRDTPLTGSVSQAG